MEYINIKAIKILKIFQLLKLKVLNQQIKIQKKISN